MAIFSKKTAIFLGRVVYEGWLKGKYEKYSVV